jgi:hypothetical protein
MPAGPTYEPIATSNLSGVNTVTFSSIPSTYTDLVLVMNAICSNTGSALARVNSDTGNNYSGTGIRGTGSSVASYRRTNEGAFLLSFNGVTPTNNGSWILQFQNYANTTTYKTMLNRFSWADSEVITTVGLWRNTSAINSITTYIDGVGTFSSGTTVSLYGIASA